MKPVCGKATVCKQVDHLSAVLVFMAFISGCGTVPSEQRIDNIPMYGQPGIERPDALKRADEEFVAAATSKFGSREAASKAWAAEARKLFRMGNQDIAMRRFNQAWLLNPKNYDPYWGFGQVLVERGKLDDAVSYFEKAKQLIDDPYQKVALLSDVGSAYSIKASRLPQVSEKERASYFGLASDHFRESISLDSTYAESWRMWARSLYWEGKYSEAWEKLKKARSIDPSVIPPSLVKALEEKMPEPR